MQTYYRAVHVSKSSEALQRGLRTGMHVWSNLKAATNFAYEEHYNEPLAANDPASDYMDILEIRYSGASAVDPKYSPRERRHFGGTPRMLLSPVSPENVRLLDPEEWPDPEG